MVMASDNARIDGEDDVEDDDDDDVRIPKDGRCSGQRRVSKRGKVRSTAGRNMLR